MESMDCPSHVVLDTWLCLLKLKLILNVPTTMLPIMRVWRDGSLVVITTNCENSLSQHSLRQQILQLSKQILQLSKQILQLSKQILQLNRYLSQVIQRCAWKCDVSAATAAKEATPMHMNDILNDTSKTRNVTRGTKIHGDMNGVCVTNYASSAYTYRVVIELTRQAHNRILSQWIQLACPIVCKSIWINQFSIKPLCTKLSYWFKLISIHQNKANASTILKLSAILCVRIGCIDIAPQVLYCFSVLRVWFNSGSSLSLNCIMASHLLQLVRMPVMNIPSFKFALPHWLALYKLPYSRLTLYSCWLLEKPNATYAHFTRGHGAKWVHTFPGLDN